MNQVSVAATADWERQRAFLAVMQEGSLSAASRLLQVAQPTVRRRIEDLERAHGVVLFTRSAAGLLPTAIARELLSHAQAMAIAAQSFGRAASAEAGSASGVVRITASEVVGVEVLPPMLEKLRRSHPGLVIELSLSNRTEDLLGREADIAVRMVKPTQAALVAKRIGAIPFGLHAHRRYLRVHGSPATLEDLKNFALIGFETDTLGIRTLRSLGLSFQADDFAFRCDNDLAQLAAIRAGLGIGVCQIGIARRDRDLVQLFPKSFHIGWETWVVTHEDQSHVHRVRLVYDAMVSGLTAYVRGQ